MGTPRLHPDTIEAVKQRADITDVVSEHVVLKKRGKDFVGLCPFHDDKSPSFTVSPGKQFYYCFSCGAGGNAIKFLMELNKTSFSDVVLNLAQRYQVPVRTLEPEQRQELQRQLSLREQLYEILALTARFYEHALRQPLGQTALAYLHSSRKLSDTLIQQFQLGYAPAGWSTLYSYLVEQKYYPVGLVEQAGLIVPRKTGDGYYDRFRDRLMIPIQDLQGRVIGFGGRTLTGEEPKYLNSPETALFDKGKTLFALDKARAAIAKQDQAVVVEGYFDVMALHAAGMTNVVAALGTALSLAQVRQLLRYTESKQIVLNFDADAAGTRAAERAIGAVQDLAYRGEVQLRVLNLPDGKDADEFLQAHGPEPYRHLLATAPLWIDWQIEQILKDKDLRQADQFQQGVRGIVDLLGRLPNATLRTHYIHHCAERLSRGNARLALQLEVDLRSQVRGQRWHGRSQKWERPADFSLRETAEAQLLRVYLHCPESRQLVRDTLEQRDLEFSLSHHRFLWRQILAIEEQVLGFDLSRAGIDRKQETVLSLVDLDLIGALRDCCTEFPQEMQQVYHLLELDECAESNLTRPVLVIRAAAASLEYIMCEKRCRHLLAMWEEASRATANESVQAERLEAICSEIARHYQRLSTADEDGQDLEQEHEALAQSSNTEAHRFQQLLYAEKHHLQNLHQQRCVSATDLSQLPVADRSDWD